MSLYNLTGAMACLKLWVSLIAALCYLSGSVISMYANSIVRCDCGSRGVIWWCCTTSFTGMLLLTFSSLCALFLPAVASTWGAYISWCSSCFSTASSCLSMWMWKKDQFGLAFIPELNKLDEDNRKEPDTIVLDMQAEMAVVAPRT